MSQATLQSPADLIGRAQAGHRSALGHLFEEYMPFLRGVISKLMGPALRRTIEPDDVLQETLMVASARFEHFDGTESELRTWLGTLARRRLIDVARHNGRLKRALKGRISLDDPQTADGETLADQLPSDLCTASQVAVKRELTGHLTDALSRIDPREAEVLRMRYVDGMSLEAIGAQVGTGRHGASGIVARGLRHLRRILPRC